MTDIIERLRLVNACAAGCGGRCSECPDTVAREAADEIERLRAERDELLRDVRLLQEGHNAAWEGYSALASERFTLRAERDRLREVQAAILAALKETGHD
jgi:uncharacterized coiled-coil DUF342 family protein